MNRTKGREQAFKLLYSLEIQKEDEIDQIELFFDNNNIEDVEAQKYISDIAKGVRKNEEEMVRLISDNLKKDWSIERISKVNITLLKLAIYEIKYKKLPYKAIINEVVELAKLYGDDNSPSFINGALANIIKEIKIEEE